ncbi:hypothetical protein BOX15_Mlig026036g1 [Macrostomum lignano]|uniref:CX domain-containing protein n=1 Tax=Macrostomum lignano TaxID=282301 RepID=A0A267FFM4_9PLAT|nr:hypothetical protein BOX15_Mlig026036g1 [Macrostomum lignano]
MNRQSVVILFISLLPSAVICNTSSSSQAKFKGGVPASESMLRNDTVYISDKIRHLLVDPSTGLFKSNVNFEVITVCFARRFDHSRGSRQYEMFVCPEQSGATQVATYSGLVSRGETKSYCCGAKSKQWCCDFIEFSDKHREEQKRLSKVLIAIICVGSFAVVILIVLIVACIHHSCSRQNGRSSSQGFQKQEQQQHGSQQQQQSYQGLQLQQDSLSHQQAHPYGGFTQPQVRPEYPPMHQQSPEQYPPPPPPPYMYSGSNDSIQQVPQKQ